MVETRSVGDLHGILAGDRSGLGRRVQSIELRAGHGLLPASTLIAAMGATAGCAGALQDLVLVGVLVHQGFQGFFEVGQLAGASTAPTW